MIIAIILAALVGFAAGATTTAAILGWLPYRPLR